MASAPLSSSSTLASSSSQSATPNLVISNIANLIPIKLDSTNFLLWKSLFRPILHSHHLEHFIDGSQPIPPREIAAANGKLTPNHAFSEWFQRDQTLLSWINATLSESTLPYIVVKETAKDAWESLEHSMSRRVLLQCMSIYINSRFSPINLPHVELRSARMTSFYTLYQAFLPCIDRFKPPFAQGQGMTQFP
ncbi:hypothetical protein MRB53_034328 [Persea americana]|uniref:Uncharacterized protein n=1 Tax=Persea americana TaxID=3435 RepID=A0ACC2KYE1_PERAE|nr:hypothetical protein MRB53_034328 [Persea americana]